MSKEKDCYNCVKNDVCIYFLHNKVKDGKYLGCKKHIWDVENILKMNKIYLITYRDHNTIEGFVEKKGDFDKWLLKHNKGRREDGECIEYKDEFEIKEVLKLK